MTNFNPKIVCVGDSITGWNSSIVRIPTYPQFLQELVGERFNVRDYGMPGLYSREGLECLTRAMQRFPNPEYVILGFGTNDLGEGHNLELTSQRIITNYNQMINEIAKSKSTKPILINVPNIVATLDNPFSIKFIEQAKQKRDYHNQKLSEYCATRNIPLADICSVLKDEHFFDALHPNEEGARLIAQEVYKLLPGEKQ
jgi:sialate O-acetylesterase